MNIISKQLIEIAKQINALYIVGVKADDLLDSIDQQGQYTLYELDDFKNFNEYCTVQEKYFNNKVCWAISQNERLFNAYGRSFLMTKQNKPFLLINVDAGAIRDVNDVPLTKSQCTYEVAHLIARLQDLSSHYNYVFNNNQLKGDFLNFQEWMNQWRKEQYCDDQDCLDQDYN